MIHILCLLLPDRHLPYRTSLSQPPTLALLLATISKSNIDAVAFSSFLVRPGPQAHPLAWLLSWYSGSCRSFSCSCAFNRPVGCACHFQIWKHSRRLTSWPTAAANMSWCEVNEHVHLCLGRERVKEKGKGNGNAELYRYCVIAARGRLVGAMERICVAIRVKPPSKQDTTSNGIAQWKVVENAISLYNALGTPIKGQTYSFG